MIINEIFELGKGRYILLADYGSEGIKTIAQSDDLGDLICKISEAGTSAIAIVDVVAFKIDLIKSEVRKHE